MLSAASIQAAPTVTKQQQTQTQQTKTSAVDTPKALGEVDQQDTTDIFAIPLDTSEEEEQQEIDMLDKMQKKRQKRNAERNVQTGAKG